MTARCAALLAVTVILAGGSRAGAEDFSISTGAALTSNYISSGVTNSNDRPAVQGYVTLTYRGFYTGVWASTVAFEDSPESIEYDVYVGYGGETAGGIAYDVNYTRYLYDRGGDCCGEFDVSVTVPVSDTASLGADISYDPVADVPTYTATASLTVSPAIALSANLGRVTNDGYSFGDVGATYSLSDTSAVDLRYSATDLAGEDGTVFLTLTFDTEIASR